MSLLAGKNQKQKPCRYIYFPQNTSFGFQKVSGQELLCYQKKMMISRGLL